MARAPEGIELDETRKCSLRQNFYVKNVNRLIMIFEVKNLEAVFLQGFQFRFG